MLYKYTTKKTLTMIELLYCVDFLSIISQLIRENNEKYIERLSRKLQKTHNSVFDGIV